MDEFVVNNADMSAVDFEDVSVGHEKCFGQQQNCLCGQMSNYRYRDHILS
jgi:hypothetical protein